MSAETATSAVQVDGYDLVHVPRGKVNHLRFGAYRTMCGKTFDALVVGPPSSTRRLCGKCTAAAEVDT